MSWPVPPDDEIPNLEDRPSGELHYLGDICKIGGIIHVFVDNQWVELSEANKRNYKVQE